MNSYSLPKCEGTDPSKWNNCIGAVTLSGTKFEGVWKNGFPSDYGTFFYKNGGKYVGEFITTKETFIYHGRGTETSPEGDKYIGEFKDNKKNGRGTVTFANGEKYVGEWKDGEMHGKGTYTWVDGAKYVGEVKDSKMHGKGTSTDANGKSTSGRYENGKKVGRHVEINY